MYYSYGLALVYVYMRRSVIQFIIIWKLGVCWRPFLKKEKKFGCVCANCISIHGETSIITSLWIWLTSHRKTNHSLQSNLQHHRYYFMIYKSYKLRKLGSYSLFPLPLVIHSVNLCVLFRFPKSHIREAIVCTGSLRMHLCFHISSIYFKFW